jgi:hypothetical protein
MNTLNDPGTKSCYKCKSIFPATTEYFYLYNDSRYSNKKMSSYCIPCDRERKLKWNAENKERIRKNNVNYLNNNEPNFVRAAIGRIFKPSNQKDRVSRKGSSYIRKCWVPEITKDEVYAELLMHIQRMKDKFPESDGRLCRYCEEPWTYTRKMVEGTKVGGRTTTNSKNFSIDRFDAKQTYKKNNIVFCCSDCNSVKRDSTEKDWLNYLRVGKEIKNERRSISLPQKD